MKLLVYPGSKETEVFVRYSSLLNKYDEALLTGPQGWKYPVDNSGKNFLDLFEEKLAVCDSVLLLETEPRLQREVYEQKIRAAIDAGKSVFLDQDTAFLSHLDLPYEKVQMLTNDLYISKCTEKKVYPIYEIPVPVVFVMGLGPNTGKFNVQLALRKFFLDKGYSISQVGSKRFSRFFGITPFPSIFEDCSLSIRQRIIAFNHYVYRKCIKEHPDVMVIGIPGGVLPLNSIMFEEMGEKALLVSQAVRPDVAVLSSYAHPFNQQYFDQLGQMCKYRLNFNLKYMAVSATDITISPETQESEYAYFAPNTVERQFLAEKKYGGVNLYNIYSEEDMEALGGDILQELHSNF